MPLAPPAHAWLPRKPVTTTAAETGADRAAGGELRCTITLFQLTAFGVGATVGTGARGDRPILRRGIDGA